MLFESRIPSPLGELLLVSDADERLRALDFADCEARMRRLLRAHYGGLTPSPTAAPQRLRESLAAYFDGEHDPFQGLELATGGSPFQRAVWAALREIPSGATTSYSALARALGRPNACRAVGLANGANPIAIVVPCHRVIGADGRLTGYAGGLERKRWLLEHEQSVRVAA
ncbi:MAG TPA: methylated-DNA--[protein]-cysteine S-methyltransferase [Myxococcota bacterium]|nr:methylated-DNA--[protein]-cysteine S-methyltransferase [Myxococcota bacterium]